MDDELPGAKAAATATSAYQPRSREADSEADIRGPTGGPDVAYVAPPTREHVDRQPRRDGGSNVGRRTRDNASGSAESDGKRDMSQTSVFGVEYDMQLSGATSTTDETRNETGGDCNETHQHA